MAIKMRTIAKFGIYLSVILFGIAIGFYGFAKISSIDKEKDVNLLALVPADCQTLVLCNNVNYFLNKLYETDYLPIVKHLPVPKVLDSVLGDLTQYTANEAHGLTRKMGRIAMSIHGGNDCKGEILYLKASRDDNKLVDRILREKTNNRFSPKKERYRNKPIYIYATAEGDFLTKYNERGFIVISYQKRLIEKVIDARINSHEAIMNDSLLMRSIQKKKDPNYLCIYNRKPAMPFMHSSTEAWSEYDCHLNRDAFYLIGESLQRSDVHDRPLLTMPEKAETINDSVIITSSKVDSLIETARDSTAQHSEVLIKRCIAQLSEQSRLMIVSHTEQIAKDRARFSPYIPGYLFDNIGLFHHFILSAQLTLSNDRLGHLFVFTYAG